MRLPNHGANPNELYEKLQLEMPEMILDFSENCNPSGIPYSVRKAWGDLIHDIHSYPPSNGEPFRSAVAHYHNVLPEHVVVGNGAAELLAVMARRYVKKRALIIHPTFSEYEATLRANDVDIVQIVACEDEQFTLPVEKIIKELPHVDVVYICTPNNPTGVLPKKEQLLMIIEQAQNVNCEVVLDEAFIDFVDEAQSFVQEIDNYLHVIVVRSMTKLYAIPGIRLGYVVTNEAIAKELAALLPHWNVNGIAVKIGCLCLEESSYRQQAIQHAERERLRFTALLQTYGCTVLPSVANYVTFTIGTKNKSTELFNYLLQKGLVVRHTENYMGMNGRWLRVGMKSRDAMQTLMKELTTWFEEQ